RIMIGGVFLGVKPVAASESWSKPYASLRSSASNWRAETTSRQSSYSDKYTHSATPTFSFARSRASRSSVPLSMSRLTIAALSMRLPRVACRLLPPSALARIPDDAFGIGSAQSRTEQHPSFSGSLGPCQPVRDTLHQDRQP